MEILYIKTVILFEFNTLINEALQELYKNIKHEHPYLNDYDILIILKNKFQYLKNLIYQKVDTNDEINNNFINDLNNSYIKELNDYITNKNEIIQEVKKFTIENNDYNNRIDELYKYII